MAIYSLNHSAIGRTTHAPGTAGAHISYITRPGAHAEVLAERMPGDPNQARAWLDDQEQAERKNGRVVDKIMVALPSELSAEQQAALIRAFAGEITQGRASWLAAIHRNDDGNPHAHIVIRDRDFETGKRVAGLSDMGKKQRNGTVTQSGTERLRLAWEQAANAALWGKGVQIDRRSLKAQGIERQAQIHVGPKVKAMEARGVRPESKVRRDHRGRVIRYPKIDRSFIRGHQTRAEYNNSVKAHCEFMERHRKEFEAARAKLETDARLRAEDETRYAAERARKAQEAREAEQARQAQEEARLAQEARERAAADRYEAMVEACRKAEKTADPAKWQIKAWTEAHPWRARLHNFGLVKAGPLAEIESREKAAWKALNALLDDPEGKRAYEAREAARKEQFEADWQERERQSRLEQAKQREQPKQREQQQSRRPAPNRGRGGPDFGM